MYLGARHPGRRRWRRALRSRLADERGFSLIELLVATVAAIVVTTAMGAIVITSVHFTSNYNDRTDANQEGRTVMEKIVQYLNSSCVQAGYAPIQAGSDSSHLIFVSALSDSPTITPNLYEVQLSGGALTLLTNAALGSTGSSGSTGATGATGSTTVNGWSFSGTQTSYTLLPYATNAVINNATTPVFQYYGYDSSGTLSTNLDPTGTTLSSATAADVAEVIVSFEALPGDDWNATGRSSDITDSVVLRLTPASSNGSTTNAPCT